MWLTVAKVRARGRGGVALAVALVVAALALAGGAGAQTAADKTKVDQEIDATKKQVDTASAEEQRLLGLIEASTARKAALDAKVAGFDSQIAAVQRQLDAAQSKLAALEAQQRATEARLGEARQALTLAKEELGRQAIAAYTGQSEAASYASMLLNANSLGDLASKRSYMRAVVGSQTEAIAATERLRDEVGDLGKQLDASKAEAQGQRDVVASQRAGLQASRDAQAAARAEVQAEIAQTDKLKGEVVARKEEFEAHLEDLEEESAAIAETLRRRQAEAAAAAARAATSTTTPAARRASVPARPPPPSPTKAPGRLLDARARRADHVSVRVPDPPDLRHLPPAHRHRLRRQRGHADPGLGRRRGRQRQLVRRLRQRHDHRPRRRHRHPGGAPVVHVGVGRPEGHPGPDHRPGGLHRRLHRPPRPLRSPRQRRPCEPGQLPLRTVPRTETRCF